MKGKINRQTSNAKSKIDQKFKQILPTDFKVVDIIVRGKRILADITKMMKVADCQSEELIKATMNKAASYYFYFGRVEIDLEDVLEEKKEAFEIWFASKTNALGTDDSEKAKERAIISKHNLEYLKLKNEIRMLSSYCKQASIAKKALEKNMSMLQSIGAFLRKEIDKPDYSPNKQD